MTILHLMARLQFLFDLKLKNFGFLYFAVIVLSLGMARFSHQLLLSVYSNDVGPTLQLPLRIDGERSGGVDSYLIQKLLKGNLYTETGNFEKEHVTEPEIKVVPFTLSGTLTSDDKNYSRAVISLQKNSSREYRIGDKIGSFKILIIGREFIILKSTGSKQKIRVNTGDNFNQSSIKIINKPGSDNAKSRPLTSELVKIVSLRDIKSWVDGKIPAGFGVRPQMEKGKIVGYRIIRVSASHPFFKMGVRNGDIIKSVNGFKLNGIEIMMDILVWLKGIQPNETISISLLRKNKPVTLSLHLRN